MRRLRQRQNGAAYFGSLISPVIAPSISPWLSMRSIKAFVARVTCKLASSPDSLWLSGHEFHTNAALLDCDVATQSFFTSVRGADSLRRDGKTRSKKANARKLSLCQL